MTYAATNVVYENPDDLGSYELRSLICAAAVQVCAAVLGSRLRAIVLTGSFARNEATFSASRSGFTFLSDADFLLILDERTEGSELLRNCAVWNSLWRQGFSRKPRSQYTSDSLLCIPTIFVAFCLQLLRMN